MSKEKQKDNYEYFSTKSCCPLPSVPSKQSLRTEILTDFLSAWAVFYSHILGRLVSSLASLVSQLASTEHKLSKNATKECKCSVYPHLGQHCFHTLHTWKESDAWLGILYRFLIKFCRFIFSYYNLRLRCLYKLNCFKQKCNQNGSCLMQYLKIGKLLNW